MKTQYFLLLAVLCLCLLLVTGYAQPNKLTPEEWEQQALQRTREIKRSAILLHWDSRTSNALVSSVLGYPECRDVLGVSDEQYQQINDQKQRASMELLLEEKKAVEAVYERAGLEPPPFGPLPRPDDFSAEDMKEFQNISERYSLMKRIVPSDVVGNALTTEQHRKINEALLANMGLATMPVISPSRFEGLNLTDAQREQMRILEKEIEPKLEIFINNYTDSRIAQDNRLHTIIQEQKGEALREKTQEANKIIIDDAEFNRHFAAMVSHERAFATVLLKEIGERNILTKEQWERLQDLIDDPPELAKVLRRVYGGGRQSSESGGEHADGIDNKGNEENKGADWQPGPGSWKPGDAIPEQYRQERQEGRFPRGAE